MKMNPGLDLCLAAVIVMVALSTGASAGIPATIRPIRPIPPASPIAVKNQLNSMREKLWYSKPGVLPATRIARARARAVGPGAVANAEAGSPPQGRRPRQSYYPASLKATARAASEPGSQSFASAASREVPLPRPRSQRANIGRAPSVSAAQAATNGGYAKADAFTGHPPPQRVYKRLPYRHETEEEEEHESFVEPEKVSHYARATGVARVDNDGVETKSYVRATDTFDEHEEGREDSDHFKRSSAYGRTFDEDNSSSYNKADHEEVHTPNLYKKKKSTVSYQSNNKKAERESGVDQEATDRHRKQYEKDLHRKRDRRQEHLRRQGAGFDIRKSLNDSFEENEEEEQYFDNHGLGSFVGVDGVRHDKMPSFIPNMVPSASATSAGTSAGVGTSETAANSATKSR